MIPAPSRILNIFRYQKISKHRRVHRPNDSVVWDERLSTENCDITLWSKNFFDTRKEWYTKGFTCEFFRHCETKNFQRKILILTPFLSINFFATGSFLKHSTEGFIYEIFRYCETKHFERKSWYPPHLVSLTCFGTKKFLNTEGFIDQKIQ